MPWTCEWLRIYLVHVSWVRFVYMQHGKITTGSCSAGVWCSFTAEKKLDLIQNPLFPCSCRVTSSSVWWTEDRQRQTLVSDHQLEPEQLMPPLLLRAGGEMGGGRVGGGCRSSRGSSTQLTDYSNHQITKADLPGRRLDVHYSASCWLLPTDQPVVLREWSSPGWGVWA